MQNVKTSKVDTLLLKDILKKTGTGGGGGGSTGGLTNTELRATPVPVAVSGNVTVSNPTPQGLTDAQIRATPLPVSGTITVSNPTAVGLTDAQLRASAVPVSGTVAISNQVSQPLTDAQIRATALPVSIASMPTTPVTGTFFQATQPVSAVSLPLPTGAATSAAQTTGNNSLASIDGKFSSLGQKAMAASAPVVISSDQSVLPATPRASTSGGATPYKLISAATTNATSLKASAGQVYSIIAIGTTANIRYLKFYNKASAPTVGTDVPVLTIPIPGNTQGAGLAIHFTVGTIFSTGIAFAITAGVADADSAAVGASDVIVNLTYA